MHLCVERGHNDANGNYSASISIARAQDMIRTYGMSACASLTSHHFDGNAIDMNVTWVDMLSITNASGVVVNINDPRDNNNTTLHTVSRSYSVIKKVRGDFPHWSINGN
ncbi:hypothetical protein AGMMS49545_23760 [Betaproteobacteria bacterium]|nr:hypothetical protein AGMMS49545_23760 [Betaproteobacteria bacterium]GHU49188.1 hypothetical protein AGMMS50289_26220 [Betaproteobacteria bacterium]